MFDTRPQPESSSGSSFVHRMLSLSRKPTKAEAFAVGFLAVQASVNLFQKWQKARVERDTVVLKFTEGSEEYRWLVAWLSRQPRLEEESQGRQFVVRHLHSSNRLESCTNAQQEPESRPNEWSLVPDAIANFRFEGLTLSVSRGEPQKDLDRMLLSREVVLSCVTRDMEAINRLLRSIYEVGNESRSEKVIPKVCVLNYWGEWDVVRNAPTNRNPVLSEGVMDSLKADLSWFLGNEEWYHSVGVPYRRGYLFHGIPGSGKTTTAIALAAAFRKHIYILPLAGMNDSRLLKAINSADRDSLLLLEDIDCISVANDRDTRTGSADEKLTLQGLLNALDGVASKDGRLVIATTNRREVLDRALIRPGRFDREFEFTHADHYQIAELCRRFGLHGEEEGLARRWHDEKVSMATVQQRLLERCGVGSLQS